MLSFRSVAACCALLTGFVATTRGQSAPEKPRPDAEFGNWLYQTPDPKVWTRTEKDGALIFTTDQPEGDFCMLTLFADTPAEADFPTQFNSAVSADQKAKGMVRIEADSGPKPGKSAEGFDVLTRNLRVETTALHSLNLYLAGHSGEHFDLAAFQTSSDSNWKQYGAQASRFLLSLKLASSLPAAEVAKLLGRPPAAEAPPTLPGFDDAPAATVAPTDPAAPAPVAEARVPDRPLDRSPLVVNHAVIRKDGKPINGIKLSQHDMEIYSPSIAVGPDGVIHVAFVEKHRTTYALAAYYRSSRDGGKTWSDAKNLSEDMPGINVGRCLTLVDGRGRVYVVWRCGLALNFPASPDQGNSSQSNLVYRVLDNGHWSRITPVFPAGSAQTQDDAALSYFAVIDPAGRLQVVWNALPDKWHPELTKVSGTYRQHLAGVGNGLVFEATLDGANPGTPREVFLTPVAGQDDPSNGGYGTYCDGLDTLNGYVDASGAPHFVAAISSYHDQSLRDKSRYQLIEDGKMGPFVDLPPLSYHGWRDIPTLLVDAAGKRHLVALYPAGEHPSIRDYVLGADEDPVIIRQTVGVKGSVDGFQAYQGPNGRMVAIMQMNDSGERANGETYVSVSTGHGWSTPVNVTNNAGRRSFASTQRGAAGVAIEKSYYPGPAAAAFDRDGHLLLLMINNEYSLFSTSALSVTLNSGSSSTPTLQFLRF